MPPTQTGPTANNIPSNSGDSGRITILMSGLRGSGRFRLTSILCSIQSSIVNHRRPPWTEKFHAEYYGATIPHAIHCLFNIRKSGPWIPITETSGYRLQQE